MAHVRSFDAVLETAERAVEIAPGGPWRTRDRSPTASGASGQQPEPPPESWVGRPARSLLLLLFDVTLGRCEQRRPALRDGLFRVPVDTAEDRIRDLEQRRGAGWGGQCDP